MRRTHLWMGGRSKSLHLCFKTSREELFYVFSRDSTLCKVVLVESSKMPWHLRAQRTVRDFLPLHFIEEDLKATCCGTLGDTEAKRRTLACPRHGGTLGFSSNPDTKENLDTSISWIKCKTHFSLLF